LDVVELTGNKQPRKPGKLSGGEQQRVVRRLGAREHAEADPRRRASGNIDSETADTIIELLRRLAYAQDTTVLL
jgi:putative ABC transport system ATP-binding protein